MGCAPAQVILRGGLSAPTAPPWTDAHVQQLNGSVGRACAVLLGGTIPSVRGLDCKVAIRAFRMGFTSTAECFRRKQAARPCDPAHMGLFTCMHTH